MERSGIFQVETVATIFLAVVCEIDMPCLVMVLFFNLFFIQSAVLLFMSRWIYCH